MTPIGRVMKLRLKNLIEYWNSKTIEDLKKKNEKLGKKIEELRKRHGL